MNDIHSNSLAGCRAILIGAKLQAGTLNEVKESVQELRQLAETAHIEVLCEHIQSLPKPSPTFFIGKGKVEELKSLIGEMEADSLVFDVS